MSDELRQGSGGEREMTLDEWCAKLTWSHAVNKELRDIKFCLKEMTKHRDKVIEERDTLKRELATVREQLEIVDREHYQAGTIIRKEVGEKKQAQENCKRLNEALQAAQNWLTKITKGRYDCPHEMYAEYALDEIKESLGQK